MTFVELEMHFKGKNQKPKHLVLHHQQFGDHCCGRLAPSSRPRGQGRRCPERHRLGHLPSPGARAGLLKPPRPFLRAPLYLAPGSGLDRQGSRIHPVGKSCLTRCLRAPRFCPLPSGRPATSRAQSSPPGGCSDPLQAAPSATLPAKGVVSNSFH